MFQKSERELDVCGKNGKRFSLKLKGKVLIYASCMRS